MIDFTGLDSLIEQQLKVVAEDIVKEAREVIIQPRYWGKFGRTERKNGDVVVGGYRDIVDTGELKDSAVIKKIKPRRLRIKWDSEHSADVYFGKGAIPPRRFVDVALDQLFP